MTELRVIEVFPHDEVMHVVTRDVDLRYLQKFVHGYIEHVTFFRSNVGGLTGYVNEEGLYSEPVNNVATELFYLTHKGPKAPICGPLVIMGAPDDDGDETGVTDHDIAVLRALRFTVSDE